MTTMDSSDQPPITTVRTAVVYTFSPGSVQCDQHPRAHRVRRCSGVPGRRPAGAAPGQRTRQGQPVRPLRRLLAGRAGRWQRAGSAGSSEQVPDALGRRCRLGVRSLEDSVRLRHVDELQPSSAARSSSVRASAIGRLAAERSSRSVAGSSRSSGSLRHAQTAKPAKSVAGEAPAPSWTAH
jgi:hypothetical protein